MSRLASSRCDASAARPSRSFHQAAQRDFLLDLAQMLRPLGQPADVVGQACALLASHLNTSGAYYVEIDEHHNRVSAAQDSRHSLSAASTRNHRASDFDWCLETLRLGQCFAVSDIQAAPRIPVAQREVCAGLDIAACIAAPVIKDQQLVGALCLTDAQVRLWGSSELALVQEVADLLWSAWMRARAEEKLEQRAQALERQALQLRRLASELTLVEHQTRQLLSRVLHDGLQQQLFCASLTLDGGIKASGGHPLLLRAQSELKDAMETTRSLSVDLFPPVLHSESLPEALEWLVVWARKKYALEVGLSADMRADPATADARILLFESVRELIFNAVKHAGVTEMEVQLSLSPPSIVQIDVSDKGRGFDPDQLFEGCRAGPGLGLFSIRERLLLLGGSMHIESTPGRGAHFCLRVPRLMDSGPH